MESSKAKVRARSGRTGRIGGVLGVVSLLCAIVLFALPEKDRQDAAPLPENLELAGPEIEDSSRSTFTLPGEEKMATVSFFAKKGEKRVIGLDVEATFEADSGRKRALYSTVGIACGPVEGNGKGAASSGTENLLDSTTRNMRRTLVYTAQSAGTHRCNARFAANTWDSEYAVAEVHLSSTLATSRDPVGFALEARPDQEHPVVVRSGEARVVVDETFVLDRGRAPEGMSVSVSSHLTSCVIENGSKDGTEQNLCQGELINREGSLVSSSTTVEMLQGTAVCREMTVDSESFGIDHLVHHRMIGSRHTVDSFLDEPCGERIRVRQDLRNEGPAAVVFHRNSSSVVISGVGS